MLSMTWRLAHLPPPTAARWQREAERCDMRRFKYWLWGVAERADWDMWPPRFFWRWLIKKMDRAHGWHHMDYDYD